MATKEELKAKVIRQIDQRSENIVGVAKEILQTPEPGFREVKTACFTARKFAELGLRCRERIAITGVKAIMDTGVPGPTVCVMGELDALVDSAYPYADSVIRGQLMSADTMDRLPSCMVWRWPC